MAMPVAAYSAVAALGRGHAPDGPRSEVVTTWNGHSRDDRFDRQRSVYRGDVYPEIVVHTRQRQRLSSANTRRTGLVPLEGAPGEYPLADALWDQPDNLWN